LTDLSEENFRRLLEAKGLKLDDKAFAAALQGARRLRAEVLCLTNYLDQEPDKQA
jgi:hypothetical protein